MEQLETLGSLGKALAAVAAMVLLGDSIGGVVVAARPPRRGRAARFIVRLAVGLNLVAALGATLGMTRLLANPSPWWILLPAAVAGALRLGSKWRSGRGVRWPEIRRSALPGLFAGAVVVFATLGPALSYPTGWDELVYHHVLPQRWLAAGSPTMIPDLPYSGFPSLGEILFWLLAPLDFTIAPRLLVWVCWVAGHGGVYLLLRRRLNALSSACLALGFAVSDTLLLVSANCYVESILFLDVTALLLAFRLPEWRPHSGSRWRAAVATSIIAGGAAAVKLTGGVVLALPLCWYAGQIGREIRARHRSASAATRRTPAARVGTRPGMASPISLAPAIVGVLVALSMALPFYLRPWLATGNPFYPYFCEWFSSGPAGLLEMSRFHHEIGGWRFGVSSVTSWLAAPLLLAFRGDNYDGTFGWQMLLWVLLAIVGTVATRHRRIILLWPWLVTLLFYGFWLLTAQQARFAISFVLGLVLLAAAGLRAVPRPWRPLLHIALLAATCLSVPWWRMDYYRASWLTVLGQLSRSDYVHNLTDQVYLPLVQAVDELTPADAQIMMLLEHRGFYLPRPYVIGTPLFQPGPFTTPEEYADPRAVLRVLDKQRITHLVIAKVNPGPDQPPGWIERQQPLVQAIEQCLQSKSLVPRWESEVYLLLEVPRS